MATQTLVSRWLPRITVAIILAGAPAFTPFAWADSPNDVPTHGPSFSFAGVFKGEDLVLTIKHNDLLPGEFYDGVLEKGSDKFNLSGQVKERTLVGDFADKDNEKFPFTASLADGALTFNTGTTTYHLKLLPPPAPPVASPAAQPANPLAQQAPANPLAPSPTENPPAQPQSANPLAQPDHAKPIARPLPDISLDDPRPANPIAQPRNDNPLAQPQPANPIAQPRNDNPLAQAQPANPIAQPRNDNPLAQAQPANPIAPPRNDNPLAQAQPANDNPLAQAQPANPIAQPRNDDPLAPPQPANPLPPQTVNPPVQREPANPPARVARKGSTDGGVGLNLEVDDNGRYFVSTKLSSNSPSALVGIKPGDQLIAINGKAVGDSQDVSNRLSGPVGSVSTLTILRNGEKLNYFVKLVPKRVPAR